jgi:hypothetical protein
MCFLRVQTEDLQQGLAAEPAQFIPKRSGGFYGFYEAEVPYVLECVGQTPANPGPSNP